MISSSDFLVWVDRNKPYLVQRQGSDVVLVGTRSQITIPYTDFQRLYRYMILSPKHEVGLWTIHWTSFANAVVSNLTSS